MYDPVNYETKANTFFLNFLIPVNDKFEIFANTMFYKGEASIGNVNLDSSDLIKQPGGMDYPLYNESLAGFSNLDLDRFAQAFGFNYRFNDMLILDVLGEYDKFGDNDPYIISYDGNRFFLQAGVAILF